MIQVKSVHITNYYHKNSGGISTAYNKLLEAANRRERYVRLIVPGERTQTEDVGKFARIYYVKANYSPVFDRRYRVMLPWKTYIFDKAPIKTILREEKPEIIEIGEKYTLSLMAGLLRTGIMNVSERRPMLVHFSCERMDDNVRSFIGNGKAVDWFTRRYMGNYNFPMFDFHIANSDYTAQELSDAVSAARNPRRSRRFFRLCWRMLRAARTPANNRIFVNQCGVDNELFTAGRRSPEFRSQLIKDHSLPQDAKLLLYAGRISPEKNIGLLSEMMKILRRDTGTDFRLLVAGDGPGASGLAAAAEKIGGRALIPLGHISDKNALADLFANCDAFIHPNPREPFGITPLEAMASGLPVVVPDSGGVLSYASHANAWIAKPTGEGFSAAVCALFQNDDEREKRVRAGLSTAGRYTWESSTDSLFALYDRMYDEFRTRNELFVYEKAERKEDFDELIAAGQV